MMSVVYRVLLAAIVVWLLVADVVSSHLVIGSVPPATRFLAFPAFILAMAIYEVADAIREYTRSEQEDRRRKCQQWRTSQGGPHS